MYKKLSLQTKKCNRRDLVVYPGGKSKYTVEKVIFYMDANPFESSHIRIKD